MDKEGSQGPPQVLGIGFPGRSQLGRLEEQGQLLRFTSALASWDSRLTIFLNRYILLKNNIM